MYILGIWDGHDAGAAIIKDGQILIAINEERLTRRKLEVAFPSQSIKACLAYLNLSPQDIAHVAISSYGLLKTLLRLAPGQKEDYYLIRRKKKTAGPLSGFKKRVKYLLMDYGPNTFLKRINRHWAKAALRRLNFSVDAVHFVDHHLCHAAAAAFCSRFQDGLVITLDGVGDGLSGTISRFSHGELLREAEIPAGHSFGIFFEHVTNLLNMRELEDEGKVMALANYAYPIIDFENPLLSFMHVDGLDVKFRYSAVCMYQELAKVFKRYPSEQFALMAQRTLEVKVLELIKNALLLTGKTSVALAGGVFSNIKVNRLVRMLPAVKECFIFPHMGDGGLAVGAALEVSSRILGQNSCALENVFLGSKYGDEEIRSLLEANQIEYQYCDAIEREAAQLVTDGNIVFWFQGRMEYGPRALGHRSILALPNSPKIRDLLNLCLKLRVWYQPFCPSMLEEDAGVFLEDNDFNQFMTMAFKVKENKREFLAGVTAPDGSCRAQIVGNDGSRYEKLLLEIKKLTGAGVVLNTSFNIHGEPLVSCPQDAIDTFKQAQQGYLIMGDFLIKGQPFLDRI